MRYTLLYAVLMFFFLSTFAFASSTLKLNRIDASGFPDVKLYVNVEDNGVVVDSISSSDLNATLEDSRDVRGSSVVPLKNSEENVAIMFSVDTSRSMKKEQLEAIKKSIAGLVQQKADNDLIGLMSFNDDSFIDCEFTKDKNFFLTKLNGLKTSGNITVLFKATYQGLKMLEKLQYPGLRYLIVLSDGKDEGVGFKLDDSVELAKGSQIPVYTLGFVSRAQEMYLDNMVRLADLTGGEYRKVKSDKDFMTAYAQIADKILKQQIVTLDAGFKGDGKQHNLELQYTGRDSTTAKIKTSFYAPLFKEEPKKVPGKPQPLSQPEPETNWPLYGVIGALALIFFVSLIFMFKRRKKVEPVVVPTNIYDASTEKPEYTDVIPPQSASHPAVSPGQN
ncbi:MAG TPA: VWA domain-containing protein, partial [Thermodesulfovibrionia bacterium]|nr:VWA domain-containing protein [Thermodesulfovibrionia bacterium]